MAIELSPVHTTNQALEDIKAHNVGNEDGGLCRGECGDTRSPGGGATRGYLQQSGRFQTKPLRGHNPGLLLCTVTPPHYRGMSIHAGHLHYPPAQENRAAFNSKLVT